MVLVLDTSNRVQSLHGTHSLLLQVHFERKRLEIHPRPSKQVHYQPIACPGYKLFYPSATRATFLPFLETKSLAKKRGILSEYKIRTVAEMCQDL